MQLNFAFSLLLASFVLTFSTFVGAVPVKRSTGMITLPLKGLQQRTDLHPTILLQQHMNRAHRRYAKMTRRQEPSSEQLAQNLRKRFNRIGTQVKQNARRNQFKQSDSGTTSNVTNPMDCDNPSSVVSAQPSTASGTNSTTGMNSTIGMDSTTGTNSTTETNSTTGMTSTTTGMTSTTTGLNSTTGTNTTTGSNSTSGDTSSGFSQVDLDAANNGGLTIANTPTFDNSLGLDIEANDVGYVATVQAGTPPQDFNILMDSGSADFWIGAEGCQSDTGGDCGNHTFLGSKGSSSFVDSGSQFQVTYGSGQVSGNIITDNLVLAGLTLDKHQFGVATVESVQFSSNSVSFDGLMGLAQSTLSQQKVPTPVEALASNNLISSTITSYKLSRIADQNNDGQVTFGGLDTTKFDQNTLTTFDNVNTQGFWEGAVSFSVGGQDLGLQGRTGILDTGTTLIIAPPSDAAAVHAKIPGAQSDGQGGFTIPCTTTATVSLTFGGTAFDIDPQDLLFAPVDPNDLTGDCVSGISSGQIGGANEWLVGAVFLKNAYFSTDVTNNKISLAKPV